MPHIAICTKHVGNLPVAWVLSVVVIIMGVYKGWCRKWSEVVSAFCADLRDNANRDGLVFVTRIFRHIKLCFDLSSHLTREPRPPQPHVWTLEHCRMGIHYFFEKALQTHCYLDGCTGPKLSRSRTRSRWYLPFHAAVGLCSLLYYPFGQLSQGQSGLSSLLPELLSTY